MLTLDTFQKATITSVTCRAETHGKEKWPAISIGLKLEVPNFILDQIDPGARECLYRAADDGRQDSIDGVPVTTPVLRSQHIEQVKLDPKFQGWTLQVDDSIDENESMTFGACKVDSFVVAPKANAWCIVSLRASTSDTDEERSGFMAVRVGQDAYIKLIPPTPGQLEKHGQTKTPKKDEQTGDLLGDDLTPEAALAATEPQQ